MQHAVYILTTVIITAIYGTVRVCEFTLAIYDKKFYTHTRNKLFIKTMLKFYKHKVYGKKRKMSDALREYMELSHTT